MAALPGCSPSWKANNAEPLPASIKSKPPAIDFVRSPKPIFNLAKSDIIYAQNTLNKLGYLVGKTDGIWGPKSAQAIRKFERSHKLQSARGHLSELNLYHLEKVSQLARVGSAKPAVSAYLPFSAKVDSTVPLKGAPQLVIIEHTRSLMAKPNPYSEIVNQLPKGTGIYVISFQEGWYEVESENQIRGYIKAN